MKFAVANILSVALAGLVFFDGVVAASSDSKRRDIKPYPKQPKKPHYVSAGRTKTCTVAAAGGKSDDAPAILAAAKKCNNGGTVVFSKSSTYNVGTALDLTFLKHVDLDIQGTIKVQSRVRLNRAF